MLKIKSLIRGDNIVLEICALTSIGKNFPTSTSGEMNCPKNLLTEYHIKDILLQERNGV